MKSATLVRPGSFRPDSHWYPKALNATLHPIVQYFLSMNNERIIARYCQVNPSVDESTLKKIFTYKPKYLFWSGGDLFHAATQRGKSRMIVLEINSCPSGQKSFPTGSIVNEQGTYRYTVEEVFRHAMRNCNMNAGSLAVIYDKNPMENTGYAATIADVFKQPVYLVEYLDGEKNPPVKVEDNIIHVRTKSGKWVPIKAAFRYLTQRPWNRLPLTSQTCLFNPIICCLGGGRNKLIAAKAYDFFNAELEGTGLKIATPETIWDVSKRDVKLWVRRFNYKAVVKNPYSNAGQGVWPISNKEELEEFMKIETHYDRFIVQRLIGNFDARTAHKQGVYYQVGTLPTSRGLSYVFDIRMMIGATKDGFRPLATYARRAHNPLRTSLKRGENSYDMFVTNLSYLNRDGSWGQDVSRLMLMDNKDFNKLGIGIDQLIEAYIQTVLATVAIDKMAKKLISKKGLFKTKLFRSLNDDEVLIDEIMKVNPN